MGTWDWIKDTTKTAAGYVVPGYGMQRGIQGSIPTSEDLGMGYLQEGATQLGDWRQAALDDIYGQRAGLRGPARLSTAGYNPYAQAGLTGIEAMGAGMAGYQQLLQDPGQITPGAQFAIDRGIQASERGAAAGGTQLSGGQLQELQGIGQGVAQQDYQTQLANQLQLAQFGQGVAGMGLGAQQAMSGIEQQNIANQQFMQQLGLGYTQLGAQTGAQYGEGIATMYGGMAGLQSQAAMLPYMQKQQFMSDIFNLGGQAIGAGM